MGIDLPLSTILILDFGTVPTVWVYVSILALFLPFICWILEDVPTVWYILFYILLRVFCDKWRKK
jgi:hypothetical protein